MNNTQQQIILDLYKTRLNKLNELNNKLSEIDSLLKQFINDPDCEIRKYLSEVGYI